MNRAIIARNIVGILFIAVLIAFSFAQRDSQKLNRLYTQVVQTGNQLHLAQVADQAASSN